MIVLIAGCPVSGKSTLSRKILAISLAGRVALVLDFGRVHNFRDLPHPATVADVLKELYVFGRHCAFTEKPNEKGEYPQTEKLLRAVAAAGGVVVLIDEGKAVARAHYMSPALSSLLQLRQHSGTDTLIVNTQRLSWLHQDLLGLADVVVLFRLTAPADQERSGKEWGKDPSKLGRFQYIVHVVGFDDEKNPVLRFILNGEGHVRESTPEAAPPSSDGGPDAPGDAGPGEAPAA